MLIVGPAGRRERWHCAWLAGSFAVWPLGGGQTRSTHERRCSLRLARHGGQRWGCFRTSRVLIHRWVYSSVRRKFHFIPFAKIWIEKKIVQSQKNRFILILTTYLTLFFCHVSLSGWTGLFFSSFLSFKKVFKIVFKKMSTIFSSFFNLFLLQVSRLVHGVDAIGRARRTPGPASIISTALCAANDIMNMRLNFLAPLGTMVSASYASFSAFVHFPVNYLFSMALQPKEDRQPLRPVHKRLTSWTWSLPWSFPGCKCVEISKTGRPRSPPSLPRRITAHTAEWECSAVTVRTDCFQSINQSIKRASNQSINQLRDKSINQRIHGSFNQSINQRSIDKSINQSKDQSINRRLNHKKCAFFQMVFILF